MKIVSRKVLSGFNAIISLLLTLLGFSSACQQIADEYGTPSVMYGVPMASFVVKGNIRSHSTAEPIPNIQVVMNSDTVQSDLLGNYQVSTLSMPEDQSLKVKFIDVDGVINGEYLPLDTTVIFKEPVFTGGSGSWNSGTTQKVVNVTLTSKK